MIVDEQAESLALAAAVRDAGMDEEQARMLHRTILQVTRDIEDLQFNTAIARMMEFVNFFGRQLVCPREAMDSFVLLLSPFAPHIAEEMWEALGHSDTLAYEPWPTYDESLIRRKTIEVPVQVGKKVRARISVPADVTNGQLEAAAKADERIAAILRDKTIVKVIVVPGKLVNFKVK